jgi:hypothetical protein
MKHSFPFKLIDTLDSNILNQCKIFVLHESYHKIEDFTDYTINSSRAFNENDIIFKNIYDIYLSKYFKLSGHIGSNIARMNPNCYYPEHSDYTGVKLGKRQDSIIKLQIPIITSVSAGLMWRHDSENRSECLSLNEGGIYIFDNCRVHSSVNFSSDYRYWLTSRWHIQSLLNPSILN